MREVTSIAPILNHSITIVEGGQMGQPIKIAVCNRKTDGRFKNQEWRWEDILKRNRVPVRTTETVQEYPRLPKPKRDALKDVGGFVGGPLKGGIRKNGNVISRTLGALDADNITDHTAFLAQTDSALKGVRHFLHSTHSHTPATPRYRIVVPFSREVSADEYPALMRMIAKQIGIDAFDDTTYQANRLMFWSSCPSNGEFAFIEKEGEPLDPDAYLSMYADWRDAAQWPTSSRQSEVVQRNLKQQQDPLAKSGVVGAFCRAYSIEDAIEAFLQDVYAPSAMEGRYDYIPADSTAGVVLYDGKYAYSHHATDPACGMLLNAFDLVKTHKFGNLEDKAAFKAMSEFALESDKVKLQLNADRMDLAKQEFKEGDWQKRLKYMPRSSLLEDSVWNEMLILNNDPDFRNFGYNELANRIQVTGKVPWERPTDNKYWCDADTAQLRCSGGRYGP